MMAKRALIFILLIFTVSFSIVQAQENEFLGIDATSYTPGSWITVRWRVTNVDVALLEIYDLAQPNAPVQAYRGLPTEGVRDFYLPPTLVNGVRVVVYSANLNTKVFTYVPMFDTLRSQTLVLSVTPAVPVPSPTPVISDCLPTFYFPDKDQSKCLPMRQGTVQAAYQPFENGFMLWRGDSGEVWVMEKSGLTLRYPEELYGLLPDNPITDAAPKGRSVPANGFGRVWGNVEDIRKALGWSLGSEVSYTMTVQYALNGVKVPYSYMTLPDDQVVKIFDGGRWAFETSS